MICELSTDVMCVYYIVGPYAYRLTMNNDDRTWMYLRKIGGYINSEFDKGVQEFLDY